MKKSFFDIKGVYVANSFLLALLFILIGQNLGAFMVRPLAASSIPAFQTVARYSYFIGLWVVAVLYMYLVRWNRPILKMLGNKPHGNNIKGILLGVVFGAGLNLLCALAALLNGDISLHFESFNIFYFIILLISVVIQSGAEELTTRIFIYARLKKVFKNPVIAIVGNALFFSVLHAINPGCTMLSLFNILIVGILYSLLIYYFDSPWMAITAHATWNFTQSILLGLPNSGKAMPYSIFTLEAANARDSFAYSTAFGLEGTFTACTVLTAATLVVIYIGRTKHLSETDIWAGESHSEA